MGVNTGYLSCQYMIVNLNVICSSTVSAGAREMAAQPSEIPAKHYLTQCSSRSSYTRDVVKV